MNKRRLILCEHDIFTSISSPTPSASFNSALTHFTPRACNARLNLHTAHFFSAIIITSLWTDCAAPLSHLKKLYWIWILGRLQKLAWMGETYDEYVCVCISATMILLFAWLQQNFIILMKRKYRIQRYTLQCRYVEPLHLSSIKRAIDQFMVHSIKFYISDITSFYSYWMTGRN